MNTFLVAMAPLLALSCAASAQTYTAKLFTSAEYVLVDVPPRDGAPEFDFVPANFTPIGISGVDDGESRSFFEFDLTSLPSTLRNATFTFPCVSYRIGSYCDAYAYPGTNGPDPSRWNVATDGIFVSTALLGMGPYIPLPYGGAILTEFDATSAIHAAKAAGWNYIGFGVIAGPASVTDQGSFIASNYTPELDADRPYLSVTAPLPPGGCDNFSGNSIDASRWFGPVVLSGIAFLTETNQRLEFTTTGTNDACFLRWILNTGRDTQDWELKVDVNNGMRVVTASPQPIVHLNLVVAPGTNVGPINFFSLEFGRENRGYLHCQFGSSSGQVVLADTNTTATNLSLRIAFHSAQKTLSAYVDEDAGNCGYSWKPMGSTVVPADWGMTSNEFSAVLLGVSHNVAVTSTDNVFFDNFRAASCPIPTLEIARQSNGVAILWPTNASDLQLESTATLSPPICWTAVTNSVTTLGSKFTVIDLISSQAKFFRLSRIYGCE